MKIHSSTDSVLMSPVWRGGVFAVLCVACSLDTGADEQEQMSQDVSFSVRLDPSGDAQLQRLTTDQNTSQDRITTAERERIHEYDTLLAQYVSEEADEFVFEKFTGWLKAQGREDLVSGPLSGGGSGELTQPLKAYQSTSTCDSLLSQGLVHFYIYTGANFTGSRACVAEGGNSPHLYLPGFASGLFYRNIYSIITLNMGVNTVYGSHQHDAWMPQSSGYSSTPWQYKTDAELHASTTPL